MSAKSVEFSKGGYLLDPSVSGFIDYLSKLLSGASFEHSFKVRDPKRPPNYDTNFKISKIEDAFDLYFWDRGDFLVNKAKLSIVQNEVVNAIAIEDTDGGLAATHNALDAVLKWGAGGRAVGLYSDNVKWAKLCKESLIARLRIGRQQMESDNPDLTVFISNARINAGLTKYYSLACRRVLIYDGRVGAAMGLLAREYCIREQISELPETLAFQWGKAASKRNRDPSFGPFKFRKLSSYRADHWARSNLMASWVLSEAIERSHAVWCAGSDGMRRVEAALFMIGYDLASP